VTEKNAQRKRERKKAVCEEKAFPNPSTTTMPIQEKKKAVQKKFHGNREGERKHKKEPRSARSKGKKPIICLRGKKKHERGTSNRKCCNPNKRGSFVPASEKPVFGRGGWIKKNERGGCLFLSEGAAAEERPSPQRLQARKEGGKNCDDDAAKKRKDEVIDQGPSRWAQRKTRARIWEKKGSAL